MKNPKTIAIIVVFILFLIFLFQNLNKVTLSLYFWQVSIHQIILIPLVLLVGFACGFVVAKLTGRRKQKRTEPVTQNSSQRA